MLAKLDGLDNPTKVAPTTPDGKESWKPELTDDQRAKALEMFLAKGGRVAA
jgi:hypothetical protein